MSVSEQPQRPQWTTLTLPRVTKSMSGSKVGGGSICLMGMYHTQYNK